MNNNKFVYLRLTKKAKRLDQVLLKSILFHASNTLLCKTI